VKARQQQQKKWGGSSSTTTWFIFLTERSVFLCKDILPHSFLGNNFCAGWNVTNLLHSTNFQRS
jgi:hypothetical protein